MKTRQHDSLAVRQVLVSKLQPNVWNPNVMDDDMLARLRRSIETHGFVQPIVAYKPKKKAHLVIIDGFHRWKLVRDEFRWKTVPVLILRLTTAKARELTITLNYLRGEPDWNRYGDLLNWFVKRGEDSATLHERFPLTRIEVDELLAEVNEKFDDAKEALDQDVAAQREAISTNRIYNLSFGPFTASERSAILSIMDSEAFDEIDETALLVKLFKLGERALLRRLEKRHANRSAD